jgi:hypothetical protein
MVYMKVTVPWDVTPCNLKERYRHLEGTCYLDLQG